jgi:hypothetical protein
MFAVKENMVYNIILQGGELERLRDGKILTEELTDIKLQPLSQLVHVELGKTRQPDIDMIYRPNGSNTASAEEIKIIINENHGYKLLEDRFNSGILVGTYGNNFIIRVSNRRRGTPNQ